MHWDLFCRVIDNFGDIGVCLRLGRDLAARGEQVRLWLDDASALAWMAPQPMAGLQVLPWGEQQAATPAEVVVETFGCDPDPAYRQAMAARTVPPVWLNLEYLSAEPYVERSHLLPSPVLSGPGQGLTKWFFYPGFTARTGGLLREPDLQQRQAEFDAAAWLHGTLGLSRRPGEQLVSLFCYEALALPALLLALGEGPCLLLATPGHATRQLQACPLPPQCRLLALPWLNQLDYDHLLWACDLNVVRGEDSFVRAQWAGQPFLWHIYPQHDNAHAAKLQAWLAWHLQSAEPALAQGIQAWQLAWNGLGKAPACLPPLPAWRAQVRQARQRLQAQGDLCSQLMAFAESKRLQCGSAP